MKKLFHIILILIVLSTLCVCGYIVWSWTSLDKMESPIEQIKVANNTLTPNETNWTVPLLFGLLKRDFHWENEQSPEIILESQRVELVLPKGYDDQITVKSGDKIIFKGDINSYSSFAIKENGSYTFHITLTKKQSDNSEYGSFSYTSTVVIAVAPPEPKLGVSSNTVIQGDTLLIELENLPEGEIPTAQTELSTVTFMPLGDGKFLTYAGIADSREPGEYLIKVKYNNKEEVIPITVKKGDFNRQDLWIDVTAPSISEANSDKAYAQFRETIRPFYETTDEKMYWSGNFLQPVEGRLSSEYGLLRYTNGGATPRRHSGIDLAAPEGTPIKAPANGKVVFSDYLLNTGNTLVIEHGGGLKSYYFHLTERAVEKDALVKAGQMLGEVGTTGYSTGPHLHFELRIGSQNLDPFKFFNGTGGIFTKMDEE